MGLRSLNANSAADSRPAARFVLPRTERLDEELVLRVVHAVRRPDGVVHAAPVVHEPPRAVPVRVLGPAHEESVARAALRMALGTRRAVAPPIGEADRLAVIGIG